MTATNATRSTRWIGAVVHQRQLLAIAGRAPLAPLSTVAGHSRGLSRLDRLSGDRISVAVQIESDREVLHHGA